MKAFLILGLYKEAVRIREYIASNVMVTDEWRMGRNLQGNDRYAIPEFIGRVSR